MGPTNPRLAIGQRLRAGKIFDPGEAVIPPLVSQMGRVQLPCQPLAAIEDHADIERKPGLHTHVGQSEHFVSEVDVVMETFPRPAAEIQFPPLPVTEDLVGNAVLQRAQYRHEAVGSDAFSLLNATDQFFLVGVARQVLDGASLLLGHGLHAAS